MSLFKYIWVCMCLLNHFGACINNLNSVLNSLIFVDNSLCLVLNSIDNDSILEEAFVLISKRKSFSVLITDTYPRSDYFDCPNVLWWEPETFIRMDLDVVELKKHNAFLYVNSSQNTQLSYGDILLDADLDLTSDFYILEHDEATKSFTIFEAFKSFSGDLKIKIVCQADETSSCDPTEDKMERRKDLTGTNLRAVIEYYPPLSMYDKNDLSVPPWGVMPEVFSALQRIMNFTYTLSLPPDGKWGSLEADGVTFNGMIGMLQRKEVDISIGSLDHQETRARVADFSSGIVHDQCKLFIISSGKVNLNYYEVYFVFRHAVWQALAITVVFAAIIMCFHFNAEPSGRLGVWNNVANAIAVPCRAVILKGHSRIPILKSGRMAIMTVLCFGIFMFSVYRGGILSRLAVKIDAHPVNSLDDIYSTGFKLGTIAGANTQTYFQEGSEGSIQKQVWHDNVENNLIVDNDQGLQKVITDSEFAFFMYETAGKASDHYPCGVTDVGPGYLKVNEGLAYQKNSSLTRLFEYQLAKMRERGLLRKILGKWIQDNSIITNDCQARDQSLGYQELMGIFTMLIIGIITSLSFLLSERMSGLIWKQPPKKLFIQSRANSLQGQMIWETLTRIDDMALEITNEHSRHEFRRKLRELFDLTQDLKYPK